MVRPSMSATLTPRILVLPFHVLRTETLPAAQRSISLTRVERLARTVRAATLAPTVKQMLKRGDKLGSIRI